MVRNIKIHGGVNMFEKEAEERARKLEEKQTLGVYDNDEDLARDEGFNNGEVCGYENGFQDGAEFGYNKANEWHYMKDGLPKKDGFYLVAFHNIGCDAVDVGQFLRAEWWHSDEEIRVFINKNIYAWKELPNPPKDIE